MIIFRYLAKEVFFTLIALTAVLMLIFLSNQFVQYLNRAASGKIPGMIIMKLMMLELPNLMGLLLPLGFYMALLLAYGRLYAENEMTILRACGYGPKQLLKHSFIMAGFVAVFVGVVMIWVSPFIAVERAKLLRSTGIQTLIQTIMPGRFHAINSGQQVFYVQSMSRDHSKAEQVFLAKKSNKEEKIQWDILWADKAYAETDPKTLEEYIVLQDGKEYQGTPGNADYQIAQFADYKARLPHPTVRDLNEDLRTASITSLWPLNNSDPQKGAELQWRLSIPLMVFTLTFVAVPLSRVNSRSGKFAKLLPAVILYILYANFMFVARDAAASGKIPLWIGMGWIHLLVVIIGLLLIWRNQVKLS
ncbi:LPS export ABC transporter permease LptF [Legionella antarctica]|uniref:Lipopolysaccharide export system permease protein LptF n=1 Tax=Legionella antarctica TaxID=2708020 RepID=A0A6F8T0K9_9GAMM|nr:LPS export ABC transporter permease LptF [Legionella antarctica]BCA94214.1 LPS export ABC transporter permease LptF [Legionella antarctica]